VAESRSIEPDGSELDVEGQTRFLVDNNLRITDMVVTRTCGKIITSSLIQFLTLTQIKKDDGQKFTP
jgi:hypothetical protein